MEEGQQILFRSSLEIIRLLGEGAFGRVYLVKKNFLNGLLPRFYAFKVFHEGIGADIFKAEATALFQVRSHHCVGVHSIEEFDSGRGLLLEYVDGVTIEELAKCFELNQEEIDSIVSQIYQGLMDLQSYQQIHGDLSPRNIMVDRKGRVVLLDFGLTNVVEKGVVVGQPAYLSWSRMSGALPTFEDDRFALSLIKYDLEKKLIGKKTPQWFWEQRKKEAHFDFPNPSGQVPRSLMNKVEKLIGLRENPHRTVLQSLVSKNNSFFRALNLLFLLLVVSTTNASSRNLAQAHLAIRSIKWVTVELSNGEKISSNQDDRILTPGVHLLKWKTAKKTGVKILKLQDNQRVILSDSDFE